MNRSAIIANCALVCGALQSPPARATRFKPLRTDRHLKRCKNEMRKLSAAIAVVGIAFPGPMRVSAQDGKVPVWVANIMLSWINRQQSTRVLGEAVQQIGGERRERVS
jgi:hypothetical protein